MTVVTPNLFTEADTTGALPQSTRIRNVIGAFTGVKALIEAFQSTGVLLFTASDVRDWQRHALDAGTQIAVPTESVSSSFPRNFSAAIQDVRRHSGLTWQELADALGVSRRAVHHWAVGERVSARHAQLINELAALVGEYEGVAPETVRAQLLTPTRTGQSPLSAFRARSMPTRSVPLSTISVADILSDEPLEQPEPVQRAQRRSQLAPRRIGSGGSSGE